MAEFDQHLLSVEELFILRRPQIAIEELWKLDPATYQSPGLERGLYLALCCEANLLGGDYEEAITAGVSALELLAPSALNRRVGRTLWNLSKCYSLIGELTDAEMRARDAISAFRRAEHRPGVALGLNELAKVASIRSEYAKATEFLQDALILSQGDKGREQLLKSNLGRLHIYTGRWDEAEKLLSGALEHDLKNKLELPAVRKYLSLGYLSSLKREFGACNEYFSKADELIEKNNFSRERLNLAEYRGHLAILQGDYLLARTSLTKTLAASKKLAPESALITQIGRLLTEALMGLELTDDAFVMVQKTLERCSILGERVELGVCHVLLGQLHAERNDNREFTDEQATHQYEMGLSVLREIGDPLLLGRSLLRAPDVYGAADNDKSRKALKEAVAYSKPWE